MYPVFNATVKTSKAEIRVVKDGETFINLENPTQKFIEKDLTIWTEAGSVEEIPTGKEAN